MDSDVVAAIVVFFVCIAVYAAAVKLTEAIIESVRVRRRFRPYDGGCRHSAVTCWYCDHGVRPPF